MDGRKSRARSGAEAGQGKKIKRAGSQPAQMGIENHAHGTISGG